MNKMNHTQLRAAFWRAFPQFQRRRGARQNQYNATIRSFWVEFVDNEHRAGSITDRVAQSATL